MLDSAAINTVLLGTAAALVGLGLIGLLLPLRPARFVAGIALAHGGIALLLVELAALSEQTTTRLHALGLAAIVMGVLLQSIAVATLAALQRRTNNLRPQAVTDAAEAEWHLALGDTTMPKPGQATTGSSKNERAA